MARGFSSPFGAGSTDRVQVSSWSQTPTVSISAWMWIDGTGGGAGGRLFDHSVTANALMFTGGGTNFTFKYNFNTTAGLWTITPPSNSVWHHVAVVYDANNVANVPVIYIDGATVTVTTNTAPVGTVTAPTTTLDIGNRGAGDRVWDGKIAEFAIWNNELLTADEVIALAKGSGAFTIRPGSIGVYCPLFGQTGEPGYNSVPATYTTQTITGTAFQPHPGVSLQRPEFM